MNVKICMYDNGVGANIPEKINTFPVEVILGSTINEIHKIAADCQLFCVFTPIKGEDFIVPTEKDKNLLVNVLNFGNKKYKVSVKEKSIWYDKNARSNIIISNTVHLTTDELSTILMMYLNQVQAQMLKERTIKPVEMYVIVNTRNNEEIIRTPNMDEAIRICNATPCSVITNRQDEIIYKSKFGKVAIPANNFVRAARLKSRNPNSNGIFNIKINV